MLDIKLIRENPQVVKESIQKRGLKVDLDKLLKIDSQRRKLIYHSEKLRAKLKQASSHPGKIETTKLKKIKIDFETQKAKLAKLNQQFNELMLQVPNLIAPDTPIGGEENNRVEKIWGKSSLNFKALSHLELNTKLNFVDFESGAKSTGHKFYYLLPNGTRLWLALLNFTLELVSQAGYQLMMVPNLVNHRVAQGTGFLPRGVERQIYQTIQDNLNLIATSEMPLAAYHLDEVIDLSSAKQYSSFSPCYRLEAGSYGKFSQGLFRVHQFDKLELYIFCRASESDRYLKEILGLQEKIYQKLQIPYRITRTATGDLSAAAYQKYDLEYYSPYDNTYRELTSCSNCTDFQTRRLNIRYREGDKLLFAHSLNGTAITSSRSLIAIIENYQNPDGSVSIPLVLRKYYGATKL